MLLQAYLPNPLRSCDRIDESHDSSSSSWMEGARYRCKHPWTEFLLWKECLNKVYYYYLWSRLMASCPTLILIPSLTFLFMTSLASTRTLVILWCSCAQCSPTAVSGFLRLRWSFIPLASVLPVSPMYVRGNSGHSTWYIRPYFWASGVFMSLGCTRMDRMVLMGRW